MINSSKIAIILCTGLGLTVSACQTKPAITLPQPHKDKVEKFAAAYHLASLVAHRCPDFSFNNNYYKAYYQKTKRQTGLSAEEIYLATGLRGSKELNLEYDRKYAMGPKKKNKRPQHCRLGRSSKLKNDNSGKMLTRVH
ncbi:hypothetical protein [Polycladidibacter hongkongensis]|uniref:hypothetical protein n=1 Tax=Polycladidibacter hongkongensis TaxID=1647556 RepID=UPI00082C2FA5|nr:hypothetical protein [Pseudovibrio hongkongensis]